MFPHKLAATATSLAFAPALSAQTTASVTGNVTAAGASLPDVVVTISSPALQGTRSAVTGDSGTYDFVALPPGEYRVVFARQDFVPVTGRAELRLSQPARVDAAMVASFLE